MKLVSGRARITELNGRAIEKRLNTLQGCEASALLTHHVLQELTHHLVDRGPPLGRHGPGLAQKLFFDDQSHVQPLHCHSSSSSGQHSTDSVQPRAAVQAGALEDQDAPPARAWNEGIVLFLSFFSMLR
jgi:hypothetical protein